MLTRNISSLLLAILMGAFLLGVAGAESFTTIPRFGDDESINWPTWTTEVNSDPYGTPDFRTFGSILDPPTRSAWEATFVKGDETGEVYLTEVAFHYENSGAASLFTTTPAGHLFIDTFAGETTDNMWDYVVELGHDPDVKNAPGDYTLWSVSNLPYNDTTDNKLTSQIYHQADDSNERRYHPWGVKEEALGRYGKKIGTASFDGYATAGNEIDDTGIYRTAFGFATDQLPGLYLPIGARNFRIGFTVTCANDVVYDGGSVPQEDIPEPTTLLLLGTGLLGLVSTQRRRPA